MKTIRINANHAQESFDNQPAITYNGDSKGTSIFYKGKTIKINCLLSNTKVCKWDKKYPENHNHYIITVSYEGKRLSFDWFDSLSNFRAGNIDKSRNEIIEMFYSFLSDCKMAIDYYSFEDFRAEFGGTKEGYNACKRALQKFERVFYSSGIDLYDLANYLQEKYNF